MSKQHVFTPLYRGVRDTLEIASTSQNRVVVGAWSNHQWSVAWFGYYPMKEEFQIHSKYRTKSA